MKDALYAVIRYNPDPARNELLNLGVVIWNEETYRLRIDDEAIDRVIRENPYLAKDALRSVQSLLYQQLASKSPDDLITAQQGFPVHITEPRYVALLSDGPDEMDTRLDDLLRRIVHPRRRGGGGGVKIIDVFERRFRPFLRQHKMMRDYQFFDSLSGTRRTVDFFANSGANIVVDTLQMDLKSADGILKNADAQALKAHDVLSRNSVEYLVCPTYSSDPKLASVTHTALLVLSKYGAHVLDVEAAAKHVEEAIAR